MSDSIELFRQLNEGENRAANEIFDRYVRRLIRLTRTRISSQMQSRFDPEDVVQSAYRSFFVHAANDEFVLERAGDLWRLLAGITIHKLQHQIARHSAAKRSVGRELNPLARERSSIISESSYAMISTEPTPEQSIALTEELQRVLADLPTSIRSVLVARLQGDSIDEIASSVGRSQRTVRRWIESARLAVEKLADDIA